MATRTSSHPPSRSASSVWSWTSMSSWTWSQDQNDSELPNHGRSRMTGSPTKGNLSPRIRGLPRMPEGPEKSSQHRAARNYHCLAVDARAASMLARRITEKVLEDQAVDLSADPADQSDVRHVAEASLAGVTVLATKDERFQKWAAGAVAETGVRVMHPSDVILAVDELARAQAYQPLQLQDTRYRLVPVRAGTEEELLTFLHR